MRKLIGGIVLIAGLGGLAYWGAVDHAADMQLEISERAEVAVSQSVHGVETQVSGRDIRVSGLADSSTERASLLEALNSVQGRRVVIDDLTVLPTVKPFTFAATRKGGQMIMQGNVPSEGMRLALGKTQAAGAEGLTLAAGAPERWESAVGAGLASLSELDEGALALSDRTLRLSGLVDTPQTRDAIMAGLTLPEGYVLESDIDTRDDGNPVAFDISYDASEGAQVVGKLPSGLDVEQIAAALGLEAATGEATAGLPGDPAKTLSTLQALQSWLPELETLTLSGRGADITVSGAVSPGVDAALVQQAMRDELNAGLSLELRALAQLPQQGATRVNVATGQSERFQNGFWLPDVVFNPSLEACGAQTDALLARAEITFLSGSAELGPRALRAINALAAVLRPCVIQVGLQAEIGGHTDNTGSNNFQLSADRAEAVRNAMIARGIPGAALSAAGYGASKPIADNSTQAGRAANRRTTVRWAR